MQDILSVLKNSYPKFTITQPSTDKSIYYRPFTVREEKALILAKDLGKYSDFLITITEIVDNCYSTNDIKINSKKLPIFDVEYMFLKIREKSVSEVVKVSFVCPETKETIKTEINIPDIQIIKQQNPTQVKIADNLIVNMKYPTFDYLIQNAIEKEDQNIDLFDMVINCIHTIETKDQVLNDLSKDFILEFINNLTKQQYEKILSFFVKSPRIEHTVKYRTTDGVDRQITFRGIRDFFQ